jgi:hypothetical protein
MSQQGQRRRRAKMIRAAAADQPIHCTVECVEWIKAADGSPSAADAPKRFKMRAYTGGPMSVGYYGAPVVIDMSGLTAKAPLPILMNHSLDKLVGHADEITAGDSILDLAGVVSGASPEAAQVLASAKQGFPWKASVGAQPDKMEFVGEGITTKVNGKTFTGPLYVARKSTLGEVSFVAMAADSKTSAKVAATAAHSTGKEIVMNFDQWVQALFCGDVPELREDQKAKLKAAYDAEVKAQEALIPGDVKAAGVKAGAAAPTFDLSGVIRAYEIHVATIEAKASTYVGKIDSAKLADIRAKAGTEAADLKLKALNEQWPAARLEVALVNVQADAREAMIRAERPKGPEIHSSTRDVSTDVIQAAFCRTGGLRDLDKAYKPEILEAADKLRGFSLGEILLHCAAEGGYSGRQKITDGNLRQVLQAAFSTHTLTTLLSTAGNKFLLEGFNSIPQMWREVAATRSLGDFKTHTGYRLTASLEYEEVGPAGEIKHGTVGQESYTMSLVTFGKMLAFTRQDIINDDLGALNAIRDRLGIGAAVKMENLFWTVFLAASAAGTFWTSPRGNLVTGSALAETGLNTAVKAFRDMTAPDGNMMNLEPKLLLVPTALEATAKKIYVSQEIRDTTATTKYPTANIYQNSFRPIAVPQLGNSTYTGYSATTWYLMADPRVMACAAMCFLNGQESPTIESADADFDTLGIQFRGFHDFYPVMTEYRPTVKATA